MIKHATVWAAIVMLAAIPAVGGNPQPEEPALLYPQLALGGGFQAVLILTNSSDATFEGTFVLPDFGPGSGRSWQLDGQDQSGSDRADFALASRSTRRFVLSAPEGAEAAAGVLQVEARSGSMVADLAASFFYEYRVDGVLVDSIGVPSAEPAHHAIVPLERLPQQRTNTGIAIRTRTQPSASPALASGPLYRMVLRGEEGQILEDRVTSFVGASFFDELFPDEVPENQPFIGSLEIESPTPLYLVALRQQLLDNGFQLTGIPARIPANDGPAPSLTARYRVTFQADWSAQTHPMNFPPGPHFSSLIGGTHTSQAVFWEPGAPATAGIESMAERGSTFPLASEVEAQIDFGNADAVLRGGGIGRSPGMVTLEFEVDRRFPQVTLVSMIAPSPDWFVGVHNLNLFTAGEWVDEITVQLFPYDAGTDSGTDYVSPDQDTQPREPIRQITGAPFLNQGEVAPMGSFRFERIG